MMNQVVKTQWLQDLRSGQYKQGKGRLYNSADNTYCCLGVLCDQKDAPKEECKYLPGDEIVKWASIANNNYYKKLVYMNDGQGKTFAEIADYIEEKL